MATRATGQHADQGAREDGDPTEVGDGDGLRLEGTGPVDDTGPPAPRWQRCRHQGHRERDRPDGGKVQARSPVPAAGSGRRHCMSSDDVPLCSSNS